MAPARTGRESRRRITVIFTAHTNKGIRSSRSPFHRIFATVVIKLMAPKIEEIPAKWREKIARSTDGPACAKFLARGGYRVHPVPTPCSTAADLTRRSRAGGRSQNLILFIRGKAMSGAPNIRGINQFPKPPIRIGITKKKIISSPWAVTMVLYNWSLPRKAPGCPNSIRIRSLIEVPNRPPQTPKIK